MSLRRLRQLSLVPAEGSRLTGADDAHLDRGNRVVQGNHSVSRGGKVVFIEGRGDHRVHSGSKGGKANNAGPLMDMAMLSEPMVSGQA